MLRGAQYSAILHAVIILLAIVGLPDFFQPERREEPVAISVEILPVSDISNVKNNMKSTPKKKEEKKPEKKEDPKKPQPPVKTEKAEAKKDKPKPKEEPVPTPVPEKPKEKKDVKKEEKKDEQKEEKKKKDEEEDLMAVLKAVKETAQQQEKTDDSEASSEESPSKSDTAYIDSLPLSMSEKDAIRNQIAKCWNVPAGAKDAHELVVVLRLTLEKDGSLINVYLHKSQQGRYGSDPFFRAAVDSAMRAVRACTPLQGMPAEKYQSWKDVELTFDPKDLLY